ncbi:hypothetical protein QJS66_17545 [Kocuria rhizophila]|nr:hypothetical protein QJS66_17545 [Kocuria rhizophila]
MLAVRRGRACRWVASAARSRLRGFLAPQRHHSASCPWRCRRGAFLVDTAATWSWSGQGA